MKIGWEERGNLLEAWGIWMENERIVWKHGEFGWKKRKNGRENRKMDWKNREIGWKMRKSMCDFEDGNTPLRKTQE